MKKMTKKISKFGKTKNWRPLALATGISVVATGIGVGTYFATTAVDTPIPFGIESMSVDEDKYIEVVLPENFSSIAEAIDDSYTWPSAQNREFLTALAKGLSIDKDTFSLNFAKFDYRMNHSAIHIDKNGFGDGTITVSVYGKGDAPASLNDKNGVDYSSASVSDDEDEDATSSGPKPLFTKEIHVHAAFITKKSAITKMKFSIEGAIAERFPVSNKSYSEPININVDAPAHSKMSLPKTISDELADALNIEYSQNLGKENLPSYITYNGPEGQVLQLFPAWSTGEIIKNADGTIHGIMNPVKGLITPISGKILIAPVAKEVVAKPVHIINLEPTVKLKAGARLGGNAINGHGSHYSVAIEGKDITNELIDSLFDFRDHEHNKLIPTFEWTTPYDPVTTGVYTLLLTATDSHHNSIMTALTIRSTAPDTTGPVFTLKPGAAVGPANIVRTSHDDVYSNGEFEVSLNAGYELTPADILSKFNIAGKGSAPALFVWSDIYDPNTTGDYTGIITAEDNAHNETRIEFTIHLNLEKPIITVVHDLLIKHATTPVGVNDTYIMKVTNGLLLHEKEIAKWFAVNDPTIIPKVNWVGDYDRYTPGTYLATVSATDTTGNNSISILKVTVMPGDIIAPHIALKADASLSQKTLHGNSLHIPQGGIPGQPFINNNTILNLYSITDASTLDFPLEKVVTVNKHFDIDVPDIYIFTITAMDDSGNSIHTNFTITVVDKRIPLLHVAQQKLQDLLDNHSKVALRSYAKPDSYEAIGHAYDTQLLENLLDNIKTDLAMPADNFHPTADFTELDKLIAEAKAYNTEVNSRNTNTAFAWIYDNHYYTTAEHANNARTSAELKLITTSTSYGLSSSKKRYATDAEAREGSVKLPHPPKEATHFYYPFNAIPPSGTLVTDEKITEITWYVFKYKQQYFAAKDILVEYIRQQARKEYQKHGHAPHARKLEEGDGDNQYKEIELPYSRLLPYIGEKGKKDKPIVPEIKHGFLQGNAYVWRGKFYPTLAEWKAQAKSDLLKALAIKKFVPATYRGKIYNTKAEAIKKIQKDVSSNAGQAVAKVRTFNEAIQAGTVVAHAPTPTPAPRADLALNKIYK